MIRIADAHLPVGESYKKQFQMVLDQKKIM
jgi:hypothetical protein